MLLETSDLHAGYGEIRVLQGVSLVAQPGEITAIVGANGAGKSTLMRVLAGLLPVRSGQLFADGQRIDRLRTHERVASGIVLVPEGRLVFPDLSVYENLVLGAVNRRALSERDETISLVYNLFPRLAERKDQHAGTMSGGEQQMLALGRGLMALPKVLLLDEPTLGLAPAIAKQVFRIVPDLRNLGITIVIAEQDLHRTLRVANFAYVLEHGAVAAKGTGKELINDPIVRQAYLGHTT
ncbi:MAG: ABC transporter ATP-binding protein [Rhodobacterales bacterium]|jgi:branched-chain amino acid transport system ATP-binding protein|uniref:ABC transporter ATP-binding protein n=1 Tax=uncultured Planktomarina sp. TaxID=1538529 RepID=UPI003260C3C3|tara:strand:- start:95 stop:808 length:714 start_codon:yes stop_codon:yes gene_type:complete